MDKKTTWLITGIIISFFLGWKLGNWEGSKAIETTLREQL